MSYDLLCEPHGFYLRFSGVVNHGELLRAVTDKQSHPDYDRLRYAIDDFSLATTLELADDELMLVSAHLLGAQFSNRHMVTVGVSPDPEVRATFARLHTLSTCPVYAVATLEQARKLVATGSPSPRIAPSTE